VAMLQSDPELQAVTAADRISNPDMIDLNADSVVKIVTDCNAHALYISRSVIPYDYTKTENPDHYHVIGAMAMRNDFLFKYVSMEQTPLEKIESVEQLRILENGYKLGIVKGNYGNLGVNTPEELEIVKKIYEKMSKK
jgi:3-deoxy-manno-octulosonate cytidylyltransferase (CMP-KDO synthetase)